MYLIVDLEATCWEVPKVPDLNEIIDIGVVVCNKNYVIQGTWSSFIKPKINPVLSSFCKRLTKIKQSEIDSALSFDIVFSSLTEWLIKDFSLKASTVPWFTWGSWDLKCLTGDCERNNLVFPFGQHRNLKDIYSTIKNVHRSEKCNLKDVLEREGILSEKRLHRGLSDALAAAQIAKLIFEEAGHQAL